MTHAKPEEHIIETMRNSRDANEVGTGNARNFVVRKRGGIRRAATNRE